MTLIDFIHEYYPIQDKVSRILTDPVTLVMERDDLPCDAIKPYDGKLQKVVYLTDEEYIPITELIAYSEEDIQNSKDEDLKTVWYAYMKQVVAEVVDFDELVTVTRQYAQQQKRKEQLLECTR